MKKFMLIAVDDDREYDIYDELDALGGIDIISIEPRQMKALKYALNDVPTVYMDPDGSDFDSEDEHGRVMGYGKALTELYGAILIIEDKRTIIEELLGTELTDEEYEDMRHDWKVFCNNPYHYRKSLVIDVVKLWLDDKRKSC